MKKSKPKNGVASNRKATFDIEVEKTYEAGIVLTGMEIKSVRADRVQLNGAYVKLMRPAGKRPIPEPVLIGMHLALAGEPQRTRRILLSAKEITELERDLSAQGKTAVPLKLYFKGGWLKLQIGVGKGRKMYDKREVLKKRDLERQVGQQLKGVTR